MPGYATVPRQPNFFIQSDLLQIKTKIENEEQMRSFPTD